MENKSLSSFLFVFTVVCVHVHGRACVCVCVCVTHLCHTSFSHVIPIPLKCKLSPMLLPVALAKNSLPWIRAVKSPQCSIIKTRVWIPALTSGCSQTPVILVPGHPVLSWGFLKVLPTQMYADFHTDACTYRHK